MDEGLKKRYKDMMKSYHNKYKGKRCFIIGNGPSLNKTALNLLENEYTFGVNGIFYKYDEMGFKPTFYVVEDRHVVADNVDRIKAIAFSKKFFPEMYRDQINDNGSTIFFNTDLGFYQKAHPYFCKPRFSLDCSEVVYAGQTVTYMNLQLAFYMGFDEVYLIGMDFSYKLPWETEQDGHTIVSKGDDPNHFHPDYFGKGKKWHDPKLENCLLVYKHAKKIYEEHGRKIYNATIGGKLELFERVSFSSLFSQSPHCEQVDTDSIKKNTKSNNTKSFVFSSPASTSNGPQTGKIPVARGIIKWHLRWGGLAFLLSFFLLGWAFSDRPFGLYGGLLGIAILYATAAYVAVVAKIENQVQSHADRELNQHEINEATETFRRELKNINEDLREQMASSNEDLREQLATTTEKLRFDIDKEKIYIDQIITNNSKKPYQHFLRKFSEKDEKKFEYWAEKIKVEIHERQLRYFQQRISFIEDQCRGRMASDIQDSILRVLIALSIDKKEINILEIGTLFGVNAILLYDILSCYYERVNITLIDPLEGFYGKGVLDWGTGLPVSPQILKTNFERSLIPKENWTLIQAYSTDDNAVKLASAKKYDMIYIDGDHSYEGVIKDFDLYSPLVSDSGYIVFDDYHNKRWPDVTKAVDNIIMKSNEFEHIGSEWETAVFRKK